MRTKLHINAMVLLTLFLDMLTFQTNGVIEVYYSTSLDLLGADREEIKRSGQNIFKDDQIVF